MDTLLRTETLSLGRDTSPERSNPCSRIVFFNRRKRRLRSRSAAFTLIELFIVAAVIALLAILAIPAVAESKRSAATAREVAAARNLMIAYLSFANEHAGILLSGKDTVAPRTDETGRDLSGMGGMIGTSWVHTLRPYLGGRYRSVIYVNDQAAYYYELTRSGVAEAAYQLACFPSFGINLDYVGGSDTREGGIPSENAVRSIMAAQTPASLITFAGATQPEVGGGKAGFWRVEAPAGGNWMSQRRAPREEKDTLSPQYGFVAFRHSLKAVTAFLDGHVELLSHAELQDMRLWSDTARRNDDPTYSPGYIE